jgi:hypothetical protein
MSEKQWKFIVANEFVARRGIKPVLFPVGCKVADVIDDQSERVTFLPLGASDRYEVDRETLERSIRPDLSA